MLVPAVDRQNVLGLLVANGRVNNRHRLSAIHHPLVQALLVFILGFVANFGLRNTLSDVRFQALGGKLSLQCARPGNFVWLLLLF